MQRIMKQRKRSLHFSWPEAVLVLGLLAMGIPTALIVPIGGGTDEETHMIRVWDMAARGQIIRVLQGHYGVVNALAVPPRTSDGQELLVSGSYDKTVRLWDVRSGRTLAICATSAASPSR